MKRKFWETTVGKIATALIKIGLGLIIKNQRGVKGTENEKRVDELLK